MSPRALCFGFVSLLLASTAAAAEPEPLPEPAPAAPAEPPPYAAWQGSGHAEPVGAAPLPAPPPSVGAPAYSRRTVELIPQLGLALPSCRAGDQSADRCDGVTTGGIAGFTGLWRVTPYFAWGGGFELAAFRYDPPERLELSEAGAAAVWLGLTGRVYFVDEGSLDPYLQLGLGVGALGTTATDRVGVTWEETGAGPAAQIGGGLDFYLGRSIRLGPALSYTRVFVDKIRRCRASGDGDCRDVSKDENGYLNSYFSLTARLSILLGGEL
ncbi:MAG: hypothetical protein HS104_21680 [Polyangiaceae bacterium]|nr:hypothetical protein [Polyangiaceae bacterium]MCL4753030.1 hypothetical protein [Myxococcales bacterium]